MIDPGLSLDIMPLLTLKAMGRPRVRIVEQLIEVSRFRGNVSSTLDYNIGLTIATIKPATHFHIIDATTS